MKQDNMLTHARNIFWCGIMVGVWTVCLGFWWGVEFVGLESFVDMLRSSWLPWYHPLWLLCDVVYIFGLVYYFMASRKHERRLLHLQACALLHVLPQKHKSEDKR